MRLIAVLRRVLLEGVSISRHLLAAVATVLRDGLVWRLAVRNVARNGRRSAIVVVAVAVGIAGVFLTNALSYGMLLQMLETAIETDLGHIQLHAVGYDQKPGLELRIREPEGIEAALDGIAEVTAVAPRVRAEGLLFSTRASAGVGLVAIAPAREGGVTTLAESVIAGTYLGGGRREILIGEALGKRLEASVGTKLVLSVQDVTGDMTGESFRVGGVFRTASRRFDERNVFLELAEGQRLLGFDGEISELAVRVTDREEVTQAREEIVALVGDGFEVRSWDQLAPLLVYMVDAYRSQAWIIYAAVFVAMAFGVANVLLMSVYERIREIGVMMAVGMHPRRLVAMILAESLLLSVLGLALGLVMAVGVVFLLGDGIDLSAFSEGVSAYGIGTRLKPVVRAPDLLVPALTAVITAGIAGLWPAVRAARVHPADAVRSV